MTFVLAALLAQAAPGEILDLERFKLTLPEGRPTEVKQPQLATYRHADYFRATDDGKGVVFRAPCGGATTKGSSYPRSELREMAAWSTTRGRHRIVLRQAITRLPEKKRHVVAGQIHDADDDVVMIRLEKRKLFVEVDGKDGPVLTRDYALGDVFTVEIVAEKGEIVVTYNGVAAPAIPAKKAGCYFKAGCYTQSNVKKGDAPDAAGEVVIYDLGITHEE